MFFDGCSVPGAIHGPVSIPRPLTCSVQLGARPSYVRRVVNSRRCSYVQLSFLLILSCHYWWIMFNSIPLATFNYTTYWQSKLNPAHFLKIASSWIWKSSPVKPVYNMFTLTLLKLKWTFNKETSKVLIT